MVNGVWIGIIHSLLFSTYTANNPEMMENYRKMNLFIDPQVMMLVIGPVIGAVTGLIAGLFAFIVSKVVKKPRKTQV